MLKTKLLKWQVNTTARNPARIKGILRVLKEGFEGKLWNATTQSKFADELVSRRLYKPRGRIMDKPLRARTWVGILNTLGLASAHQGRPVIITDAGKALLNRFYAESEILLRQLLKWQFPSPVSRRNREMDIAPYVAVLRLIVKLGYLTKHEITAFLFLTVKSLDLNAVARDIKQFRKRGGDVNKSVVDALKKKLQPMSSKDISRWKLNFYDYADVLIRYLVFTRIFKFKKGRLSVASSKRALANLIAKRWSAKAKDFDSEAKFYEYYYDPSEPNIFGERIREAVYTCVRKRKMEVPPEYLEDVTKKIGTAKIVERVVKLIQRNRKLAQALKKMYHGGCQICRSTFKTRSGDNYSEEHHIIPLGEKGADKPGNIVILCPTCHMKLHYAHWERIGQRKNVIEIEINGQPAEVRYKLRHYNLTELG